MQHGMMNDTITYKYMKLKSNKNEEVASLQNYYYYYYYLWILSLKLFCSFLSRDIDS